MNLVEVYSQAAEIYRKNKLEEQRRKINGDQAVAFLVGPDGERMSLGVIQSISMDVTRETAPVYTIGHGHVHTSDSREDF
ncbi:hypothetical protein [Bacillus atrophaeus]|uniref:hypothetical protein n=1 Tax=Bacillus atrophaeus TaxID=1452 RepID=UPI002E1B4DBE|nr:hypothetical protein [Bacillus atrophaeus]